MTKRIIIFTLLMAICLSLFACKKEMTNDDIEIKQDTVTKRIIKDKEIFFVNDELKEDWKEPLSKLLSNVLVPYGEHGEIMGYEAAVDPNAPTIPACYECGLLDITRDGVPELLIYPLGYFGSSGTATYFIYDIFTGEKLGSIGGGISESWCEYYYSETDEIKLVGQYWLRGGWEERDRYILTTAYYEEYGEFHGSSYLHTYHRIAGEQTDIVDEDPDDMYYTATWIESYPETLYYIEGKEVYLDDYYEEYDWFIQNCIRIPETELVLIDWDDVTDDEDDYVTRGSKMAQALITSKQRFIDFKNLE